MKQKINSGILPDFQFSKEQNDSESNLYFLRARYYDPELGRFISKDPVKGHLNNPQSQNPYSYSLNNPINFSDPSGLDVYGLCVNVNIGLAIYGTCSVCVVYSTNDKSIGALGTLGAGGTTGATASIGFGGLYSNAPRYSDILGQDIFTGVSGGEGLEGSGDVSWSHDDPSIKSYNLGVGLGANFSPPFIPGEFHGGTSYTGGSTPIQLW